MKKFTDLKESNKGSVSVKTQQHDFGKMMTVHHGSNTSYPLHPEHQKVIKKLRPGDKTAFKDETNSSVHAHREGDNVILHRPTQGSGLTKVPYHHFDENVIEEEIQNIEEGPKDPPFEPSKSPFKKSNNPNRSFLDSVKALAQKGKKDAEKKSIKETTGDRSFDSTMKNIVKGTSKQRTADRIAQKKQNQERARNAFGSMFGGGNPTSSLKVKEDIDEAKTNPTNVTQLKNLMALAKVKKNYIEIHNPTNGKKVNENSLHADFLKMMKDKGIQHRVHGTPEQEKARTSEKLASNKAKVDASPKKPAGPGTFGVNKGYGQGRYMGD